MYTVQSSDFIKCLSAAIALSSSDVLEFHFEENKFSLLSENLFFSMNMKESEIDLGQTYAINVSALKPISTLKASVATETTKITIDNQTRICTVDLGATFKLDFSIVKKSVELEVVDDAAYLESSTIKTLSKIMNKLSKDNFKGCLLFSPEGFVIPGEFHTTLVPCDCFKEWSDSAYQLKHTQLNKLLKLGQEFIIKDCGNIVSYSEDLGYRVVLPKATKKALVGLQLPKLASTFSKEFPCLKILQPKLFKDLLKSAKMADKTYDLCSIQSELSSDRIVMSFYQDKKASNKFIYPNVETPAQDIELFLQTKHLLALSEIATQSIAISFSSPFEPLKVVVDDLLVTYLMQGVIAK